MNRQFHEKKQVIYRPFLDYSGLIFCFIVVKSTLTIQQGLVYAVGIVSN